MPREIKITNWPEQKNLLSAVAIGISILSFAWSMATDNKLEKLQKANIILSPSITNVIVEEDGKVGANLELALENIGKSKAENVSFKIYRASLDESIRSNKDNPVFDDELKNAIEPGTSATFGNILTLTNKENLSCTSTNSELFKKSQIFLIIYLKYFDSYTQESIEPQWYFYKYSLNGNKLYSLLKKDNESEEIKNLLKETLGKDAGILEQNLKGVPD